MEFTILTIYYNSATSYKYISYKMFTGTYNLYPQNDCQIKLNSVT